MIRARTVLALVLTACAPAATPPPPTLSVPSLEQTSSPTVAAAPSPTAQLARFGIAYGPFLRIETDGEPFGRLDGNVAAVSPDGWSLAYWHTEFGAAETTADLRVLDLRTGNERSLLATGGDRPGSVLWRSDGGALAVTAISVTPGPQGADPPPAFVRIRIADLVSGQTRELARIDRARFQPIAWNAATRIIVGAWIGEGGLQRVFRVRDDGTLLPEITPAERYENIVGSEDGNALLATYAYGLGTQGYSGARIFRADSFAQTAARDFVDNLSLMAAQYRHGHGDILALVGGGTPPTVGLEIWPADLASPGRRAWTAPPLYVSNINVRIDGRMAYLSTYDSNTQKVSWLKVDLDTGVADQLPVTSRGLPTGPSFYITDTAIAKLKPVLIPPTITRDDAIARVRAFSKNVLRVDRIDAKLTMYRDVVNRDPAMTAALLQANAPVWAVAVGGDIRAYDGDRAIPMQWGLWYLDARTAATLGFNGDQRLTPAAGTWPYFWDDLPDRR